jgi:Flp pilus assembly CpaE family ATPase
VSAVREAHRGGSIDAVLDRTTTMVEPGFHVLTGLPRPDRWPELRPAALESVLDRLRTRYRLVVADTGFCLEQDEELAYDTLAPRRNGAALTLLARADRVLAVCAAEPVGIRRLLQGLDALAEMALRGPVDVVLNRAPHRGGDALAKDVAALLADHAYPFPVHAVADDPRGFVAWRAHGGTFAEHAPRSPVRAQVQRIVEDLGLGTAVRDEPVRSFRPRRRPAA